MSTSSTVERLYEAPDLRPASACNRQWVGLLQESVRTSDAVLRRVFALCETQKPLPDHLAAEIENQIMSDINDVLIVHQNFDNDALRLVATKADELAQQNDLEHEGVHLLSAELQELVWQLRQSRLEVLRCLHQIDLTRAEPQFLLGPSADWEESQTTSDDDSQHIDCPTKHPEEHIDTDHEILNATKDDIILPAERVTVA